MEDHNETESESVDVGSKPWLLITHGKQLQMQTFYDIFSNRYYTKSIPEICEGFPFGYSFGWLVMKVYDSDEQFLLHLESKQKVKLPPVECECRCCVLSAPPSDPDCHVLFVERWDNALLFCRPGDQQVHRQDFGHVMDENDRIAHAAVFQGKIFCVTFAGRNLFRVEFSGSALQVTQLIEHVPEALSTRLGGTQRFYLVECCGDLLLVHLNYAYAFPRQLYDLKVFKLDSRGKTWVEVNDIGNNAILLSIWNAYSVPTAECNLDRNSIYHFLGYDRHLYVFALEDGSITRCLPFPHVRRNHTAFMWFMFSGKIY